MKKRKDVGVAITLILIILSANLCYAVSNLNSQSSNFFTVNKTQASKGDNLELSFDISKIDAEKFSIILNAKTNSSTSSAEVSNDVLDTSKISASSNDFNIEKNSEGDVVIDIDKSKLSFNKITIYYTIPDLTVGTEIEFTAKAISNTNYDMSKSDNSTNSNENYNLLKEEKITVKIVEKSTNENEAKDKIGDNTQENGKENYQRGDDQNGINNDSFSGKLNDSSKSNVNESNEKNYNNQSNSIENLQSGTNQEVEETYSGSYNNYLSSLSIDGLNLNSEFNKEKLTYFASASDISSLCVTATAEDENAIVNITGNTDLSCGINKILISVTAENGNVRYYRIFVNVSNS